MREGRSIVDGFDARPLPGLPRLRVTFAGRLHPEKGVDVLLEALALLPDPPTTLLLGDGPLRESLTARSHALGLSDRVLLPGWVRSPGWIEIKSAVHGLRAAPILEPEVTAVGAALLAATARGWRPDAVVSLGGFTASMLG